MKLSNANNSITIENKNNYAIGRIHGYIFQWYTNGDFKLNNINDEATIKACMQSVKKLLNDNNYTGILDFCGVTVNKTSNNSNSDKDKEIEELKERVARLEKLVAQLMKGSVVVDNTPAKPKTKDKSKKSYSDFDITI